MKIGITGAAGFIGSNLTDALLAEGHNVIGLDNLSMGSRRNIAHLEHCSRFQFHQVDVRELDKMREVFRSADCIVHLAAYKIPRYGKAIDTLEINSIGSKNVLE
jgi:UDP-glucose 4-epimerase